MHICSGTWSNAGETLTIGRYAGGAVLANGGTTLTISPGSISGAAFQPTDQGLPLYLAATDGSGVTLIGHHPEVDQRAAWCSWIPRLRAR